MNIPPFWKKEIYEDFDLKGEKQYCEAWGWSFESMAQARSDAIARCKRIFQAIADGRKPDHYGYFDVPMREEILETIDHNGQTSAMITRNRYGALVLNTQSVCFVDVDFPENETSSSSENTGGFLRNLFSSKKKLLPANQPGNLIEQNIREWARHHPERSFRVYRTSAGFRLLFTDHIYDPTSEEIKILFDRLGCDPLYRTLTVKQKCFRARLSPKPWRCKCPVPPNRYPWESDKQEQAYRQWIRKYESKTVPYAVCEFIEHLGEEQSERAKPEIQEIIDIHDEYCCRLKGTLLA